MNEKEARGSAITFRRTIISALKNTPPLKNHCFLKPFAGQKVEIFAVTPSKKPVYWFRPAGIPNIERAATLESLELDITLTKFAEKPEERPLRGILRKDIAENGKWKGCSVRIFGQGATSCGLFLVFKLPSSNELIAPSEQFCVDDKQ